MLIEALTLSLIVAMIRGGNIRRLGHLDLRNTWLIFAPGVCIALLYTKYIPGMAFVGKLSPVMHVIAYLMVIFIVWSNRHLPGMVLIGIGAAMNFTAITLNDGRMPVSLQAAQHVGLDHVLLDRNMVRHAKIDGSTRLPLLGDVIPTKRPPFPFPAVISVGDIVLSVGIFVLVQQAICPRKRILPDTGLGGATPG